MLHSDPTKAHRFSARQRGITLHSSPHEPLAFFCTSLCLIAFVIRADPVPVETTSKLKNLNQQIKANAEDSQAYANRGYTLAQLGREYEAMLLRRVVSFPPFPLRGCGARCARFSDGYEIFSKDCAFSAAGCGGDSEG